VTNFIDQLEALLQKATPGPWTVNMLAEYEPSSPNIYGIYGGDPSYEATICELWSGEHDNPSTAALICLLRNHADALLEVVRAAQEEEHWLPADSKLSQALRKLGVGE
jgi:hypothetical protein